ncbi:S8 family serine peptidase, partial [Catellatospora chokoriensis]
MDYGGTPVLVVEMRPGVAARATGRGIVSAAGLDTTSLNDLCAAYGGSLRTLFGMSEERLNRLTATLPASADAPDLSRYYKVEVPVDRMNDTAAALRADPLVAAAYVEPPGWPGLHREPQPNAAEPPAFTQDFSARQAYLGPAPGGIDVRRAWALQGGRGAGVRVVHIDAAWRFTHEDLTGNQGGVVGGIQSTQLGWRNHGTAVAGVIGGDDNGFGIMGICPDANLMAISAFMKKEDETDVGSAIVAVLEKLHPGDVIVTTIHAPGPRHGFKAPHGQLGFIAMDYFDPVFDAIRTATLKGVIVVAIAGNGAENLDDPIYERRFDRTFRDSGVILVGAGAPPPGTNGHDHGPDRSRLAFSNFGSAVDVQAWGEEVTTCGYSDLQGGASEDLWYTATFNGTSTAGPIIAG